MIVAREEASLKKKSNLFPLNKSEWKMILVAAAVSSSSSSFSCRWQRCRCRWWRCRWWRCCCWWGCRCCCRRRWKKCLTHSFAPSFFSRVTIQVIFHPWLFVLFETSRSERKPELEINSGRFFWSHCALGSEKEDLVTLRSVVKRFSINTIIIRHC